MNNSDIFNLVEEIFLKLRSSKNEKIAKLLDGDNSDIVLEIIETIEQSFYEILNLRN